MTALGWVPAGSAVRRSGAHVGDLLLVSGVIGDGWLGLAVAGGGLAELSPERRAALALRYRLPEPRLALARLLRRFASASADVSDGLLADAGHIGEASGCAVVVELDRLPLSAAAAAWLEGQGDRPAGLAALAAGGDDYEVVAAVRPERAASLIAAAGADGQRLTVVGRIEAGQGLSVLHAGTAAAVRRTGYRHR
jgi:thiamine-monophosphate kinase